MTIGQQGRLLSLEKVAMTAASSRFYGSTQTWISRSSPQGRTPKEVARILCIPSAPAT